MYRATISGLLCVLCITPAVAFTRDEVLMYIPFDGTLEPAVAAEGTQPQVTGDFEFSDGIIGQAVRVGGPGTNLLYPTAGNMNPNEGTFSIWVQSIDWTFEDAPKVNRWWVDVPGPTRFIIYHYLHSNGIFFYHMDVRKERPSIISVPQSWEPGEWKHLVGTWRDGRLRFYVNGERVPQELAVELGPIGEYIRIGGPVSSSEAVEPHADTNLDEFYVFSRALEDVEVKALYQRGLSKRRATLTIPPIAAPKLDGTIGEGEWATTAAVTGFVNRVTGLLDAEQGVAWVGHDTENLYIAQRWPIPERVRLQPDNYSFGAFRKEARRHDDELLAEDDVVGVEVVGQNGVRRIVANAMGTIGDAAAGDLSWDTAAQAVCKIDAEAWVCELAIPLADLGIAPGDSVEIRLVRTHRLVRRDEVAWPHPDYAAESTLATMPGAVQLTSIGRPWLGELNVRLRAIGGDTDATVSTGGEVSEERALAAGDEWVVERTLADTSVTDLEVTASGDDRALLAVTMPFTYPPMLEVAHFLYPSEDLLEVVVSTRGAASAAAASVEVASADGGDVVTRAQAEGEQGDTRIIPVSIAKLQPGQYIATVTIGAGERPLGQQTFGFEVRPKPEWLGNTIGIIDYVPKPWTPLQYDGDSVSCWGRTIDLTRSLLPARMLSQGEELLAAPVTLTATVEGEQYRPGEAQIEWRLQDDQRGEWAARAQIGPIQGRVDGWIEFDGCMWFEVSFSADQPVAVDALRLEIPMTRESSTLLYSGDYRTIDTGSTPTEPWARSFIPCLGLSNERVGLQWFAQSRRGWNLADTDRAIELLPGPEANTLVVNLIDTPTTIGPEPRTVWFGLHPTPVKPPLEGRRMIRPVGKMEGEPQPNLALWATHWCLGCSYPLPINEKSREWYAERRKQGVRTHVYTRLAECSIRGPWYEYFRDEWRIDPGPRMDYNPDEEDWGRANPVCQNSRSWQDWTVWSFAQAIPQVGADGWYYDVSRPALCMNHHHGCGFINERGEWEPEVQILGTRELQKRMWILAHEQLGVQISHHMSGHLWTPTQSFSDMIIDGENLTSMLRDNYYELIPLDKFRAEFMGHQWGLTSIFLPEFSRAQLTPEGKTLYESPEKIPVVRHLAGMIFLHDSLPWPSYSDLTPYQTIWAAQDELGWGDQVEFFPYWDNADYLEPMGERLVASIFRNGDRALVVLFNNTDEPQQAQMRFHLDALGVNAAALVDFETGERFALQGGVTTVPIRQRDFRLLFTR